MAATYSVDGQSFGSIGEVEDYLSGQGYDKYTIDDRRQGGIGRQSGVGMGEGAGLLGGGGSGGGGFTSFGDMFDGGGPGRSGSTFVGGPYSAGLNAVGVRPAGYTERMAAAPGPQGQRGFNGYGYTDPKTGQWVSAGRDMIDGGGPGRSGDTFQGGIFSGLLNTLGVRPAGYRQRLEDNLAPQTSLRPQMRPAGLLGGTAGTQSAVDRALNAASAGDTSAAQDYGVTLPVRGPIPVEASLLPSTDPFMQMLQNAVNPPNIPRPGVEPLNYAPIGGSSLLTQSDVNYLAAQLGVSPDQYEARAGDIATQREAEILSARPQYSGPTYEASRAADARSGGMADLQLDPLDRPLLDPGNVIGMRERAIERSPTPMVTDRLDTFMFPRRYYPDSPPSIGQSFSHMKSVTPRGLFPVGGR